MRPKTIALGETLFVASLLLVAVGSAMTWGVAKATLGAGVAAGSIVAVIAVPLLVLMWATRGRSRVGLWLLTVWTVFSAWSVARQMTQGSSINLAATVTLVQIALMVGSILLLFARPSRQWFAGAVVEQRA
jgi:hypothetical protein